MGPKEMNSGGDTIVAVSTPHGAGGLAVIRLSGNDALTVFSRAWKGGIVESFKTRTAHLGWIADAEGNGIDQVVALIFRAPGSFTGEDVVEISCHGSPWIQQAIVNRMVECGATPAGAGEFTKRAFLNGRLDLAQAEGVADMIASSSKAAARLAATQLKGDFSRKLESLRQQMVELGILLELELDFSEEEVEFADRGKLIAIAGELLEVIGRLSASFKAGNAFKSGVPVAIAGIPNAGKSTLLNTLLGDEKAIVSDIPGTTRDIIEDTVEISGILFRFIDTAGLRETDDAIERIGVERAVKRIDESAILLFLIDPTQDEHSQIEMLKERVRGSEAEVLVVKTKADLYENGMPGMWRIFPTLTDSEGREAGISALTNSGIEALKQRLVDLATSDFNPQQEMIVTNSRHYRALKDAEEPLRRLLEGLEAGVSADFLAQDLRQAERSLGEITGAVTSDEILHSIFSRYCIGK